jgi:hypothetical protein
MTQELVGIHQDDAIPDLPPFLEAVVDSRAATGSADASTVSLKTFLKRLLKALAVAIGANWQSFAGPLRASAYQLIEDSASDLARWSGLLAAGAITPTDYRWLVDARTQLTELEVLFQAGMTRNQVDRFRALVTETIVVTAIGVFLGPKTEN